MSNEQAMGCAGGNACSWLWARGFENAAGGVGFQTGHGAVGRSCAYMRCADLGAADGPATEEGMGSMRRR